MNLTRSLSVAAWSLALAAMRGLAAPVQSFQVVHAYPHDPGAYTQGLVYHEGALYESTGLRGRSSLRKVDLKTGRVLKMFSLDSRYFAEGLTLVDRQLIQLTWQSGWGFVYGRDTFRRLRTFRYSGEGWGLTYDGRYLVMSDGTDSLRLLNPKSFRLVRKLRVRDGGESVTQLNELEWVHGEIFANVWKTDRIARINPKNGKVVAWVDLTGLLPASAHREPVDVLNGIAWDEFGQRLFVTGKLWPKLFEIRIKE